MRELQPSILQLCRNLASVSTLATVLLSAVVIAGTLLRRRDPGADCACGALELRAHSARTPAAALVHPARHCGHRRCPVGVRGNLRVGRIDGVASDPACKRFAALSDDIAREIQSLRGATTVGSGTLERASEVLQDLRKEIDQPRRSGTSRIPSRGSVAGPADPGRGEATQPRRTANAGGIIKPFVYPLATTGIVVIFVVFISDPAA